MKYAAFLLSIFATTCSFVEFKDENPGPKHMYIQVQRLYYKGHTYLRFINTWGDKGDITVHDPECACRDGERLMYLDSLEYDMNIPIPNKMIP
jgi:hypothetical protein